MMRSTNSTSRSRAKNAMRLILSMRPYAGEMIFTGLSVIIKHLSTAIAALLTARMVSLSIMGNLGDSFWKYMIPLSVCVILRAVMYFCEMYYGHDAAYKIQRDTRVKIYYKFEELAPAYIHRHHTAQLGSIAMGDIELLEWFIAHTFCSLIATAVIMVVFFGVLLAFDVSIALVVILFAGAITLIPHLSSKLADEQGRMIRENTSKANSMLIEGIQGLSDYIALDYLGTYKRKRDRALDELYDSKCTYARRTGKENGFAQLLAGLFSVLIMLICSKWVWDGKMSREMYPIMLVMSTFVFAPVLELSAFIRGLGEMFGAADRIQNLFEEKPEVTDLGTIDKICEKPDVEFDHVCFEYTPGNPVLHDVSFQIPAGIQAALVGPSGAGKTTSSNLLLRYWDVMSGSVKIGGVDVRDIKMDALRNITGAVLQDPYLFHISIKDNIRMGRTDATDEEVIAAAKKAYAHEFIMSLPEGYDTVTGERGFRLSGGQKQRISIARAMLRDAPVLILDEAMSNLDAINERLIEQVLKNDSRGRTTMVIAHRLSTILNADLLIVLKDGRVVQTGTHKELIRQNGFYRELMKQQYNLMN